MQIDKKVLRVFDHVEAHIVKTDKKGVLLSVKNNTAYDAVVSLLAETSGQTAKALSYTDFVHWPKVEVKSGKEIFVLIDRMRNISVQK